MIIPCVIAEPCLAAKDRSCVDVSPVDGIPGGESSLMLYIYPDVCIDWRRLRLGAPGVATYADAEVPVRWESYIETNSASYRTK